MANKYNVRRVDQAAEEHNMTDAQTRALHVWVRDVGPSGEAWEDGQINVELFIERYRGHYASFRAYSDEYIEETGLLNGIPEQVAMHFDYQSYADDLEHEYTVLEDDEPGVFIFRD